MTEFGIAEKTAGAHQQGPRLAFVIGERTPAHLVGAHLCVRPCTEVACVQRADTSVGPYRGSKGVLYFGGVADVGYVQRSRQASTLQSYQTSLPFT